MDDELFTAIGIPIALVATIGIAIYAFQKEPKKEESKLLERAYVVPDLNRDGVEDLVIESEKGRVTYLGRLENGSTVYYRDTMGVSR